MILSRAAIVRAAAEGKGGDDTEAPKDDEKVVVPEPCCIVSLPENADGDWEDLADEEEEDDDRAGRSGNRVGTS